MGKRSVLVVGGALATTTAALAHVTGTKATTKRCHELKSSSCTIQREGEAWNDRWQRPPTKDRHDECCPSSFSSATTAAVVMTLRGGASHGSNSNNETAAADASDFSPTFQKKTRKLRTGKDATGGGGDEATTKASSTKASSSASTPSKNKGSSHKKSSPVVNEILREDDYYKILGTTQTLVKKAAKPDVVIQKAYRRRAVQTHPDKTGGDRRAFDKVAEAYDVLQDAEKRNLYDRYGKQGVAGATNHNGGTSGMGAEDLFRSFFGGTASPFASFGQQHYQQQQQHAQRNRTMRFELEVTLEDLYRGTSKTVLLPGRKHSMSVTIPRGAFHNQQIVASGVMDADANQPPGDAVFGLKQRPHPTFTRKGHDLAVEWHISLSEALTGVQRQIQHLDGRRLRVVSAATVNDSTKRTSKSGTPAVIVTGDVHVLKEEGMPKDAAGTEFGDLYIQYHVDMPSQSGEELTEAERHELKRLLNKVEGKTSAAGSSASASDWPFATAKDAKILQKASASDFGRPSGPSNDSFDGRFYNDESAGFSPFGNRRFYWSSSSGASPNPFFGPQGPQMMPDDDAGATQCRQM